MKLIFNRIKDTFRVYNSKKIWLGTVCYDDDWKCCVWIQEPNIQMSSGCLQQVINKLKKIDKREGKGSIVIDVDKISKEMNVPPETVIALRLRYGDKNE